MKKLVATAGEQLALALDPPAVDVPTGPAVADPRARRVVVGSEVLTYRLRRARRRSIGFQIDDQGLTVSAPRWVPLREIESAISEKRRWILAKQREWHEWRVKRRLPPVRFADGAALPFLGGHVTLRLAAHDDRDASR